jgi:NAD(P)H-hydrate repair Nnr-like enzyme with NAD(P)H-hydrate dehydratase domain
LNLANENDVIAFGPGAGTGQGVVEVLLALLNQSGLKLVIDADGLNVLAPTGRRGGGRYVKKLRLF